MRFARTTETALARNRYLSYVSIAIAGLVAVLLRALRYGGLVASPVMALDPQPAACRQGQTLKPA